MWRGWTTHQNAGQYKRFLFEDLLPQIRKLEGFLGLDVMQRPSLADDEVTSESEPTLAERTMLTLISMQ